MHATLEGMKSEGYLEGAHFIDDASTDGTAQVLSTEQVQEGFTLSRMEINGQKIASVKRVLEEMETEGVLSEYVVLQDGDSVIRNHG